MKKLLIMLSVIMLLAISVSAGDRASVEFPVFDTGVDPDSWVLVPAGDFYKGQHNHVTSVPYDFEIMVTNVTNAQYTSYLNEALAKGTIKIVDGVVMGYYPGDPFQGYKHEFVIEEGDKPHLNLNERGLHVKYDGTIFTAEKGYENHPMVMVSWFGAVAYADFYGWRVPSEIEWEKAARGTDQRVWPWGDEIGHGYANYYASQDVYESIFGRMGGTTPVGFYNGKNYDGFQTVDAKSPYGLYDMAGNVWQWTGDDKEYVHYRYMRGGSNGTYDYDLRVWMRNSAGPDYYSINTGFRCARDVQKAGETELNQVEENTEE